MSDARNMLFISHATPEDSEVARWLALRLAAEGYSVWCDLTKLLGGEPFWKEIETAIRDRTCKFLFLLSRHSNEKQGTRDELDLAATVKGQLKDDHFIIPIRVDEMNFSKANIRIHGLNIVDFTKSWMVGFQRLVERLQDDQVATDARFTKDAVAVWWKDNFAVDEGVSEQDDLYLSNEFPITKLPEKIRVIGLQEQPRTELTPDESPYPVTAHNRFLVSFAEPRDLLPFIEKHRLHFEEGARDIPLQRFLASGFHSAIDTRTARNLTRYLVRQALSKLALSRGLSEYELANRRIFHWFPQGLIEGDKVAFQTQDGRTVRRHLIGFSSCTARDGSAYVRNWHFGVELKPHLGTNPSVSVLPHVCFSVDGIPFESSKKQHRLRRSQCRSWYNDDWRDRILAAIFHFSGGNSEVNVPVSPSQSLAIAAFPQSLVSPVSYQRIVEMQADDAPPRDDEEYEEDDSEEDDDE